MAGTIVADTIQDGAGNSTSMDNAIYGSAKAWVNFNGISGSTAIRKSYNVSSITYVSAGTYTVTFTNALTDANYATLLTSNTGPVTNVAIKNGGTYSTTAFQIFNFNSGGSGVDESIFCASVFD